MRAAGLNPLYQFRGSSRLRDLGVSLIPIIGRTVGHTVYFFQIMISKGP